MIHSVIKIVPEFTFMQIAKTKFQSNKRFDTNRIMIGKQIINENDMFYKRKKFMKGYRLCINGSITLQ